MAVTVANTLITNTFEFWRARTNDLATAMSNVVVTTGSTTTGTAGVTQNFVANQHISGTGTTNATMNTSSVYITNSSSNIALTMPTAAQVSNGSYVLMSNSTWKYAPTSNTTKSIDGETLFMLDSFPKSQYSISDYIIHASDKNANAVHASRLFVTHAGDSVIAYVTEYSTIVSNTTAGVLGTYSANCTSTQVRLWYSTTVANVDVKIIRTLV